MSTNLKQYSNKVLAKQRVRAGPQDTGPRVSHDNQLSDAKPRWIDIRGVLELHPKGYGFLRDIKRDLQPEPTDAYIPASLVSRYSLRPGALVEGHAEALRHGAGPQVRQICRIDEGAPEAYASKSRFDALTPITPERLLSLETTADRVTTRAIDLLTPLGKGQRALIVAPPRSGKTVLLQQIGEAILANHPDVKLMACSSTKGRRR